MTRLLIAKNKQGKVVSIGLPAPKFSKQIGLHPPKGGKVEVLDAPFSIKAGKGHLDVDVMKELFKTGKLRGKTSSAGKRK
jgi:hypothetical protein